MSTWRVRLIVGVLVGSGAMVSGRAEAIRPWDADWAATPAELAAAARRHARAYVLVLSETARAGVTRGVLWVENDPWLDVRRTGWSARVRRSKTAQCWARAATGFCLERAEAMLARGRGAGAVSPVWLEMPSSGGAATTRLHRLTARLDRGRAMGLVGTLWPLAVQNEALATR